MSKIQFIEKGGRREWAVVPYAIFEKRVHDAEAARDLAACREARAQDDGFRIPRDLLTRELAGESRVRLWREHSRAWRGRAAVPSWRARP